MYHQTNYAPWANSVQYSTFFHFPSSAFFFCRLIHFRNPFVELCGPQARLSPSPSHSWIGSSRELPKKVSCHGKSYFSRAQRSNLTATYLPTGSSKSRTKLRSSNNLESSLKGCHGGVRKLVHLTWTCVVTFSALLSIRKSECRNLHPSRRPGIGRLVHFYP